MSRPRFKPSSVNSVLDWKGSPNDAVGQIVISHEDIVEAARNPKIVAKRFLQNPKNVVVICAALCTIWLNHKA